MAFYTDENLSKRIHSLRFILIAFVVFIHNTVIDRGINFADGTLIFAVPLYVSKIKEFTGTFTCTAVPLYFLTASVFLYSREINYKDNIKKKCVTIALPYFLWTALEIVFLASAQNISSAKPYFANLIIKDFSVWDWLGAFTGRSGMFAAGGHPLNYPLWFLRDLLKLRKPRPLAWLCTDGYTVRKAGRQGRGAASDYF